MPGHAITSSPAQEDGPYDEIEAWTTLVYFGEGTGGSSCQLAKGPPYHLQEVVCVKGHGTARESTWEESQ